MFQLNEKVVYPGYGVATIIRCVKRNIAGKEMSFYELTFTNKEMTILVPEDRLSSIGVRSLSALMEIQAMIADLSVFTKQDIITEHSASTWNKRNKDYRLKLRGGSIKQLFSIYKDLQLIALDKDLSFEERKLFNQIESLLIEEITAVKAIEDSQARMLLRTPFATMYKTMYNKVPDSHHVQAIMM